VVPVRFRYFDKFSLEEPIPAEKKMEYIPKILSFILSITKRTLYEKDYKQIGRLPRFFNPRERTEFK
jgi:hypothetical protein